MQTDITQSLNLSLRQIASDKEDTQRRAVLYMDFWQTNVTSLRQLSTHSRCATGANVEPA